MGGKLVVARSACVAIPASLARPASTPPLSDFLHACRTTRLSLSPSLPLLQMDVSDPPDHASLQVRIVRSSPPAISHDSLQVSLSISVCPSLPSLPLPLTLSSPPLSLAGCSCSCSSCCSCQCCCGSCSWAFCASCRGSEAARKAVFGVA